MSKNPVLVTGAAGFIGFNLARRLLKNGRAVVCVDSINSYYNPALKEARLAMLQQFEHFTFHRLDLADPKSTEPLFHEGGFGPIVQPAAQAGVRYSLENTYAYLDANLALHILEGCRHHKAAHYGSSSSGYGAYMQLPFPLHRNADHPVSLYAATEKANN